MAEPAPARRRDINALALLIVLVAFVIAGSYYWFVYRPTSIRSNCTASTGTPGDPYGTHHYIGGNLGWTTGVGGPLYTACVQSHGLSN